MKDYFYEKYMKYSYESKLDLVKADYDVLRSEMGSSETIELICVICGANGGVTQQKYNVMVEITKDRASYPMFKSLIESMYTPYTVQRVCRMFGKNNNTIRAAISILFFFASLNGRLSNDDEKMMNYIFNKI